VVEERLEQIGAPVARLCAVEWRGIDPGALGDLLYGADEVAPLGTVPPLTYSVHKTTRSSPWM
jgi:hypothetical protein